MTSDASSELVFDENKLISREVSLHRNREKYRGVYCFNKKKKSSRKYRAEAQWKIERLQTLRMHFGSSPNYFF